MYLAYPKITVGTAILSSLSTSTIRSTHEPKASGRQPDACQQVAGKRSRSTLGSEPSVLYLIFPPFTRLRRHRFAYVFGDGIGVVSSDTFTTHAAAQT
jgi:hypothetical protein